MKKTPSIIFFLSAASIVIKLNVTNGKTFRLLQVILKQAIRTFIVLKLNISLNQQFEFNITCGVTEVFVLQCPLE